MSQTITQFDNYLAPEGPAALVIREHLMPVEGNDAVFFPATYAPKKKGDPSEYNIDYENPKDKTGKNIVLVDSVGSQANRIEPMFAEDKYKGLVPQTIIKAGEKTVNLLDAGHRAGDAIARCSDLKSDLENAFKQVLKGDALPLAKLAPTSLVFGVWDSRDTQAKLPRLISSTVRAYDIRVLTRSAQYWAGASSHPVTIYDDNAVLGPIKDEKDKDERSSAGFTHVPSTGTHGGVITEGGIRRDAVLALSALKLLRSDNDENTRKLQRYILGLALVAFTKLPLGYYRQGTILVLDPDAQGEFSEVSLSGQRTPVSLTHEATIAFAQAAAKDFFGTDEILENGRQVVFDPIKAKEDLSKKDKKGGGKGNNKKEAPPASASASEGTDND
ncbi:MAG: type I-U CRISPR-associated protein Cas7 [Deltaproteobacteria bacterium]|nr:type I-U CRISPR-associated protein Cas7 [Deltaproteobacteria bacterium]